MQNGSLLNTTDFTTLLHECLSSLQLICPPGTHISWALHPAKPKTVYLTISTHAHSRPETPPLQSIQWHSPNNFVESLRSVRGCSHAHKPKLQSESRPASRRCSFLYASHQTRPPTRLPWEGSTSPLSSSFPSLEESNSFTSISPNSVHALSQNAIYQCPTPHQEV